MTGVVVEEERHVYDNRYDTGVQLITVVGHHLDRNKKLFTNSAEEEPKGGGGGVNFRI